MPSAPQLGFPRSDYCRRGRKKTRRAFVNYTLFDFIGNIGLVCLLGTYLLLQMNRIAADSLRYSALNALAAALIAVSLLAEFNLSAFLVEVFWLLISCCGIVRWVLRRRRA